LPEAVAARAQWRSAGLTVGFANGCFDLLHPGHVTLLGKAAQQCDRLIVAINSDASVARLKGPSRPVQGQNARAIVLQALKGVDQVIVFEEDTPLTVIQALSPDILFKGADYREDQVVGGDVVKAAGGRVALIDLVAGHSTTALVGRARG
jgi:D-beta-D-heptose 7-phosphate kinase/D-beta-D-heptose 1-phosphate adenosyltransferase